MENFLFTFTQKIPLKFLVEKRVKSNAQQAKSNKVTTNEQQPKSFFSILVYPMKWPLKCF